MDNCLGRDTGSSIVTGKAVSRKQKLHLIQKTKLMTECRTPLDTIRVT